MSIFFKNDILQRIKFYFFERFHEDFLNERSRHVTKSIPIGKFLPNQHLVLLGQSEVTSRIRPRIAVRTLKRISLISGAVIYFQLKVAKNLQVVTILKIGWFKKIPKCHSAKHEEDDVSEWHLSVALSGKNFETNKSFIIHAKKRKSSESLFEDIEISDSEKTEDEFEEAEDEIHEDLLYCSKNRNPIIENSSDSDFDEEINRPLRSWDEDILSYCRPMYKSYLVIIEARDLRTARSELVRVF